VKGLKNETYLAIAQAGAAIEVTNNPACEAVADYLDGVQR